MSDSNPVFATSAGSSFSLIPTFVSSMPARWKKLVSVAPGIRAVMVTPVSFSSLRMACAKDWMKAFEALYTALNVPGIVEAIEEVNSTRPCPLWTISFKTSFASWTVDLIFRSITLRSASSAVSRTKSPPAPTPAFSAIASTGRPVWRMSP